MDVIIVLQNLKGYFLEEKKNCNQAETERDCILMKKLRYYDSDSIFSY